MRCPKSQAFWILAAATVLAGAASAEAPEVITDLPVVHSLVAQVMGDIARPTLLLGKGADAHHFQLRPSQVSALQGADLVVWIGPEMTPALDRALVGADGVEILGLLHHRSTLIRDYGDVRDGEEAGHAEESHDSAPTEPEGTTHGHAYDHGPLDPHAWLDPDNAALWIGLIADALVDVDPGNTVAYRANASLAQARIETMNQMVSERLAAAPEGRVATTHDAYGYFSDHFGVRMAGSIASGDAAAPGAGHLSDLRKELEAGEIDCIFPEAGHNPASVTTLAEGTPARVGRPLDPEGRQTEPGPDLYVAIMNDMGAAISDCLSGG